MKEGIITYKFKSEKDFDSIKFFGESIALSDLRRMIEEKRIRYKEVEGGKKRESYELKFYDGNSLKKYLDDVDQVPSNSQLIVQRVPANATEYNLNFSAEPSFQFDDGPKSDSFFFIDLAKRNPNLISKGFNDIPTHFQSQNYNNQRRFPGIPIGSSTDFDRVMEMQRGANVEAKYTTRELLDILSSARFFIIKSNSQENINLSRLQNEWATTKANESKLIEAYKEAPNVILLFSVNKSSHFQGFARMTSLTTSSVSYYWKNNDGIKLGGCFKIEWITTAFLSFGRLTSYNNPLNNNEPIRKSRDTQELPQDMGKEICLMFEIPKVVEDPTKAMDADSNSSEDFFGVKKSKDLWNESNAQKKKQQLMAGAKGPKADAQRPMNNLMFPFVDPAMNQIIKEMQKRKRGNQGASGGGGGGGNQTGRRRRRSRSDERRGKRRNNQGGRRSPMRDRKDRKDVSRGAGNDRSRDRSRQRDRDRDRYRDRSRKGDNKGMKRSRNRKEKKRHNQLP